MNYFNSDYVEFFKELSQNNHKDWFDLNRSRYEKNVKIPFKEFTQLAIDSIALLNNDFIGLQAKDCIFRINRDVRFSKDKQPYKLMCSAIITPNGKKSKAINGIYFEFTPEHVRFYSGVYEIEKDDLFALMCSPAQTIPKLGCSLILFPVPKCSSYDLAHKTVPMLFVFKRKGQSPV